MRKARTIHWNNIIAGVIAVLLTIITICGVLSFSVDNKYEVTNLYGATVEIFGSGIYKYDSFFKAPILIGSDWTMLLIVVPIMVSYVFRKVETVQEKTGFFAILGIVVYYAFSLSFGVTYNSLHLVYIALTAVSFFTLFILLLQIYGEARRDTGTFKLGKGEVTFLVFVGLSNIIAWLPDIISSLLQGGTLERIETYTTEITYVLDMGIISPLVFITLYLLIYKKNGISLALYRLLLMTLKVIGIMLPVQTLFQFLAGIRLPLPVLITKVTIFVLLSILAVNFDRLNVKRLENVYNT